MSISEQSPIQITFDTTHEIADEILGGALQFCRKVGLQPQLQTLTLLWTSLLFFVREEPTENGLIHETWNCGIRSLNSIFSTPSTEAETRQRIDTLIRIHWYPLSEAYANASHERTVPFVVSQINKAQKQECADTQDLPVEVAQAAFEEILPALQLSVAQILRATENPMSLRYKGVLDEFRKTSANHRKDTVKHTPASSSKAPTRETAEKRLGMAWYKFLIYFALFAGAVVNVLSGILYLTGEIYAIQTDGTVTAETVYGYYGIGLRLVDFAFGLYLIAFAVFAIVLRNKLAKFKPNAPRLTVIFYAISAGGEFLYALAVTVITSVGIDASQITSLIVGVVVCALNARYFKRRAHLFAPKTVHAGETTDTRGLEMQHTPSEGESKTPATAAGNEIALYCRNCGTKLTQNSIFCSKCGARILTDNSKNEP